MQEYLINVRLSRANEPATARTASGLEDAARDNAETRGMNEAQFDSA